jgi:hypothetical protein
MSRNWGIALRNREVESEYIYLSKKFINKLQMQSLLKELISAPDRFCPKNQYIEAIPQVIYFINQRNLLHEHWH